MLRYLYHAIRMEKLILFKEHNISVDQNPKSTRTVTASTSDCLEEVRLRTTYNPILLLLCHQRRHGHAYSGAARTIVMKLS
jgi:hypothetical protein